MKDTSVLRIFESDQTLMRSIWLIHDNVHSEIHYAVVIRYDSHMCGYLNVDKATWIRISDVMLERNRITFEGIDSDILAIPSSIANPSPVPIHNYWIGTDYMGLTPQPSEEEVAELLASYMVEFNKLTRVGQFVA